MTPQLQQAIKLLQMSNLELGDFVAQEIEKNRCWNAPTKSLKRVATAPFRPWNRAGPENTAAPAPRSRTLAPFRG